MRLSLLLLAIATCLSAAKPIPILLLDGEQGGPYHAWQDTTPDLKKMLDQTGLFSIDVLTAPPKGADFSNFKPDFSKYKAVVLNYDAPDDRWPDALKASFEKYVASGGGVVIFHAADNAFPKWKAYNQMIGIGGWRGRNEKDGPYWFYKDGKVEADPSPGNAGSHGARLPYKLVHRVTNHPITKGLPTEWMHVGDELYARMRGPGTNMTVLATAYSDPANKGTGRDEPALMTLNFDKGRIFHTILGHDRAALNSVGFIVTFQRGTEWAATGKVTQKVPKDFPTATQFTQRPDFFKAPAK
jgi:type 1 glutamine amidotransferase